MQDTALCYRRHFMSPKVCNEICLGQRSEARKGAAELHFLWYFPPDPEFPQGAYRTVCSGPGKMRPSETIPWGSEPLLWMAGANTSNQEQMFGWRGLAWSLPWQRGETWRLLQAACPTTALRAWLCIAARILSLLNSSESCTVGAGKSQSCTFTSTLAP